MYFDDLTPYTYNLPKALPDVLNIGWLAAGHAYTTGDTTNKFLLKLASLIVRLKAHQTRGYQRCTICSADKREHFHLSGQIIHLGAAEIWVPNHDGTIIYAAPNLIYHYISEHRYRPPAEFADAVNSYSLDRHWDANEERKQRVTMLHI